MSTKPLTVHDTIRIRPLFICDSCGFTQIGKEKRFHTQGRSVESICEYLPKVKFESAYMPVGWAYSDGHHCGRCPRRSKS